MFTAALGRFVWSEKDGFRKPLRNGWSGMEPCMVTDLMDLRSTGWIRVQQTLDEVT